MAKVYVILSINLCFFFFFALVLPIRGKRLLQQVARVSTPTHDVRVAAPPTISSRAKSTCLLKIFLAKKISLLESLFVSPSLIIR